MTKLTPSLMAMLAASLFAGSSFALTKNEYEVEKDRIEAAYKSAKAQCDKLSGNAEDVCEKQAKGDEKVAKAELENRYKPSERNANKARVARADADYEVAKEKCDDLSGNTKDVCKKDAKAAHVHAVENAKVVKAATADGETRTEKAANVAEARKDAAAEKREADYKAAAERCDALSGDLKSKCVDDAKRRFAQ